MSFFFLQFLIGILFLSIVFLNLIKKEFGAVVAYAIQSFAIALLLIDSFLKTDNLALLAVIGMTVIVKIFLAPIFFTKLIRRHELTFSVNTYLNAPMTLIALAVFSAIAHSQKLSPLTALIPAHESLLSLALSAMLISLFLIMNRKSAISQAMGILSLENSMVAFALLAGLEQSPLLQIGIIFDMFIWVIIATVFISMIHRHFGSLDTSLMKHLKD